MDPVALAGRRIREQGGECRYEIGGVGAAAAVVTPGGGEDDPGVILSRRRPGTGDAVEVPRVLSYHRAPLPGGSAQEVFVGECRQDWIVGSRHDVVTVGSESFGRESRMVGVQEQFQPASRSRWRCHRRSASSAARRLASIRPSISAVNSA